MIYKEYIKIESIVVHSVGNKLNQENMHLSKRNLSIDVKINQLLTNYFISSFKSSEYFNFHHDIDLNMNEVFACASKIFDNPETLLEQSVNLAKHLYEQSTHPKIKGGEFYTVYFK
ncbi:MAG: nucleoid-associated protein, partial [Bacteroidales bacterium]|nr:nucleoid-associated protein [Bacteroidales bacterium]